MKKIFTLFTVFGLSMVIIAQTPQLLKNVNTATSDVFSGSFPQHGVQLGGNYYFPATDYNGNELWMTNGTAAGTRLIKDLASLSDRQDANPHLFHAIGGKLYFFLGSGFHLYQYDPATNLVTPGPVGKDQGYAATESVAIGNDIFFAGDWYFNQGIELLRYNVSDNSFNIYDINTGAGDSYPHNLTAKGDSLFFTADDGASGNELWLYDIANDNFQLVKDINGAGASNPSDLIIYNGKLFFTASDGISGNELWSSDGSETGTTLFADINTNNAGADSSNPAHKTVFNNKLYFSATNGNDGIELWVADDNASTASLLVDINPSGDANPGKYGFKQVGALLYFAADDDNDGMELWKTDGTDIGTEEVSDINPFGNAEPMDMYNLGDTLLFVADDGNGFELWRSVGGVSSMVKDIQPSFADTLHISGIFDNKLYFGADDGATGVELWKTDGTTANTSLVKDINFGAAISSDPQWFEPFNSEMYFGARTSSDYYFGLHKTDGTTGNDTELKPGGGAANFSVGYNHGKKAGSYVYFDGYTTATANELWRTDGTAGGTIPVKDINAGTGASDPADFIEMGTSVIFTANDGVNGRELWKSDGTPGNASLIKDINPGINDADIRDLRLLNGKICFVADDGVTGPELWITDGTTGGTVLLKDINGSATGSDISSLFVSGTKLYFAADDGSNGKELWVTDGSPGGTAQLKDINPAGSSNPDWFAQLGGWIYFSAANANNVYPKVWRTDGTALNTTQFFDVDLPFLLTNIGTRISFIALPSTSTNGFHIWSTDGTVPGTGEIEDFLPGEVGTFLLDEFTVYNGKWFLWIDDNLKGQELWQTDGTSAGTLMYDIAAGPHSSYPRNARGLNPLIFSADDGTITGREVWKLDVSPTLPVTGLQFNVTKQTGKALLEWKTFSEINNKGFRVLRSANGVQFDSIGFVAARGLNGEGAEYGFTDGRPLTGKNYYRLQQSDIDGRASYSPVRWIDFSKDGYVKAYPNPTQDILYINTGYTFRDATLAIRNMNGQLIRQTKVNGAGTLSIPVKDLPAGVYNAEVSQPGQSVKLIFIKQ